MRNQIKLKIKWHCAENPELAASSLASGLARILRPEVFKLTRDVTGELAAARLAPGESAVDTKKAQALRRRAELEAELAAINASLDFEAA